MRAEKKKMRRKYRQLLSYKKVESFNLFEIIIFYCNRNWEFFLAINTAFSFSIWSHSIPQNWMQSIRSIRSHPFNQPTIDSFIHTLCTMYVDFNSKLVDAVNVRFVECDDGAALVQCLFLLCTHIDVSTQVERHLYTKQSKFDGTRHHTTHTVLRTVLI